MAGTPVGTDDKFPVGQCTWWADLRYHALTGAYVPWGGDAYSWLNNAHNNGWVVSSSPPRGGNAIVILQPGVQGAGGLGHVAVVESTNADGSVNTSNYNWGCFLCGPSSVTFRPGSGVAFAWFPGAPGTGTPTPVTGQQNVAAGTPGGGVTAQNGQNVPSGAPSGTPAITNWVAQVQGEGIKIGLFVAALVLILFGAYLLFKKPIDTQIAKVTHEAERVRYELTK